MVSKFNERNELSNVVSYPQWKYKLQYIPSGAISWDDYSKYNELRRALKMARQFRGVIWRIIRTSDKVVIAQKKVQA